MATNPKEPDKLPESEVEERFERGIKNALAMPPKPHKAKLPLRDDAAEALRIIHAERFDELGAYENAVADLLELRLVLRAPSGLVLSDRGREWIEGH